MLNCFKKGRSRYVLWRYRIYSRFITLSSLEAKLKTIVKQNDRIIDLLEKQNRK